ncbi:enhancer of mRNA-decapping protein 3-like [Pecten maximus]|uniref:enhancer of mRNA-decapping protein 3-like n=1 Tax=Pecten maximus TaxID=6579 RepID=UPI001458BA9A|nr:enhancer of mRNA-decapping protein 3-like [Pecten maximus]
MGSDFIGSIVSLDCGDPLGTYQGQLKSVNNRAQTLTIFKAYRNGLKCEVQNITLNASDIKELKILQSPTEAVAIVSKEATPSKLSPENSDGEGCPSPVKVCELPYTNGHSGQNGYTQRPGSARDVNSNCYKNYSSGGRYSPRYCQQANGASQRHSPSALTNGNGYTNGQTGGHRYTPTNEGRNVRFTPTKEDSQMRPRRNSASDVRKKSTTPRKIEGRNNKKQGMSREDCFSCPSDSVLQEFDFESNLALFDKKAVFEEIENTQPKTVNLSEPKKPLKYRCDENVLASEPVVLQQIKVPTGHSNAKQFVTDEGLVVPSISYELRSRLFATAEKYGFKTDRQVEMVGRSASEMVLQLLGGSTRLNPKNGHQLPTVVVLCGPHIQGAQGVSCARQLSNHNVKVHLFVPSCVQMIRAMEDELSLFALCDAKRTSSPSDLPVGSVDMIINAMDSHEQTSLRDQAWYKLLECWVGQNRAPVLALDPPVNCGAVTFKWCLSISLPLPLLGNCAQVYLCDLGFPKKVFNEVGIRYISPFSHKFVVPLHLRS